VKVGLKVGWRREGKSLAPFPALAPRTRTCPVVIYLCPAHAAPSCRPVSPSDCLPAAHRRTCGMQRAQPDISRMTAVFALHRPIFLTSPWRLSSSIACHVSYGDDSASKMSSGKIHVQPAQARYATRANYVTRLCHAAALVCTRTRTPSRAVASADPLLDEEQKDLQGDALIELHAGAGGTRIEKPLRWIPVDIWHKLSAS